MKRIFASVLILCGLTSVHATLFQYTVSLDGPSEPTTSLGTGSGTVNYDDFFHTLQLQVSFSGLTQSGSSGTTASHIHAPTVNPFSGTAGVATTTPSFAGFPLGVYSGTFSNTLDLTLSSSWNPSYVTANGGIPQSETAFASALASGRAYWNIHSSINPGGEIRGFITPVPEPSSFALLALGIVGLAGLRKRLGSQA